jgi:NADP-dependent 3-hydroxy acid dehydrogenase YdfG
VAVITGGAAGIGRAVVHRFVADGYLVINVDVNADKLKQVEREEGSQNVVSVATDLSNVADSTRAVSAAIASSGGRVDALINNAGLQMKGREMPSLLVSRLVGEGKAQSILTCLCLAG